MNVEELRDDFPILKSKIIYFDNACMSLKPEPVVKKIVEYYHDYTACAGRSSHILAEKVDEEVIKARNEVRGLINARQESEIVFTRNTTEAINLVANSIKPSDSVIISDKEHNSNLVPWQKKKVSLKVAKSNSDNTFDLESFEKLFASEVKLVSIVFTSNLDGVTNPIKEIAKIAHKHGALLLVDGAQAVPGKEVDVRALDVDFLAFSGHKMLGPTGTGVLYGKKELLENLDQFIVGGDTVTDSTYSSFETEEIPMRFEAGLQDYAGIIGFGEACRYIRKIGLSEIERHEIKLNKLVSDALAGNSRIGLLGPADPGKRSGIFSFNINGLGPHEVSRMLSASRQIMTRSGAHCVHSWFNAHNLKGSCRASFYLYNTEAEAQVFVDEVRKLAKF